MIYYFRCEKMEVVVWHCSLLNLHTVYEYGSLQRV